MSWEFSYVKPLLFDWLPRPVGLPCLSMPAKDQLHEECLLRGGVSQTDIKYYSVSISRSKNATFFLQGALFISPLHMQWEAASVKGLHLDMSSSAW